MAIYIFQASLCWLGFYLIYRLLLSNVTYFQLNRCFLLMSLALGLIIPLVDPFPGMQAEGTLLVSNYLETITISPESMQEATISTTTSNEGWNLPLLFLSVYYLGMFVALLHFLYGLFSLVRLYYSAEIQQKDGYKLAITSKPHLPFSLLLPCFFV